MRPIPTDFKGRRSLNFAALCTRPTLQSRATVQVRVWRRATSQAQVQLTLEGLGIVGDPRADAGDEKFVSRVAICDDEVLKRRRRLEARQTLEPH